MMATDGKIEAAGEPSKPPPAVKQGLLPPRVVVWLRRLAAVIALLVAAAVLATAILIRHFEAGLPSTAELKSYNPPQVTRVLARDGTLLGELFVERRTLVTIEEIPNRMKLAALAAEDAAFYEHAGLNYLGMLRALGKNVLSSHTRQGGSTITQQVIKNVLLTPERTFGRKMREVILARRIESELSKDEILDLYLNHIYFGHGRYGVEEAARYYFGKSIRDVTLGEAAMLAGIIKGPGVYSPRVDMTKALARRDYVLSQMAVKGFAKDDLVKAAKQDPIKIAPEPESRPELAPEVVDEVKRTLRTLVGPQAERGGYTVTTTIDPTLEAAARAAVRKNADDYAKRHKLLAPLAKVKKEPAPFEGTPNGHRAYLGVVVAADDAKNTIDVKVGDVVGTVDLAEAGRYNPGGLRAPEFAPIGKVVRVSFLSSLPKEPKEPSNEGGAAPTAKAPTAKPPSKPKLRLELGPEGALVAIDVRSREILALVGSYEGVRAGLDRTNAHRQPGSTFKSFVYSYGLHSRQLTPATIVETNPAALHGYRPDNYDEGEGKSPKRLREALAQSVNVAAVWSLQKLGPASVVTWAKALGIESKMGADLSLALGSYEVTPREMAGAYATFAAGGVYEEPILIQKIVGPGGVAVPLPERAPSRRVLEENEAYVMTSLLTSVVRDGTGKRAKSLGRPIAGKTGTSNQAKDAWFVGYSTDIACAVWTGYDDPTPMGAGEAGASVALPAFVDFMKEAHKKRPAADFPVPAGLSRVSIDPATGLKAYPDQQDAMEEIFLAGTEPTETASPDAGADGADAGAPTATDAGGAGPAKVGEMGEAPPF
ncbi:Multimodular transpeptidase-transglycosylase [Minicystis rosea]|nr:Multimodular transpeptidase-transglycosylase [Minicystis rosea]